MITVLTSTNVENNKFQIINDIEEIQNCMQNTNISKVSMNQQKNQLTADNGTEISIEADTIEKQQTPNYIEYYNSYINIKLSNNSSSQNNNNKIFLLELILSDNSVTDNYNRYLKTRYVNFFFKRKYNKNKIKHYDDYLKNCYVNNNYNNHSKKNYFLNILNNDNYKIESQNNDSIKILFQNQPFCYKICLLLYINNIGYILQLSQQEPLQTSKLLLNPEFNQAYSDSFNICKGLLLNDIQIFEKAIAKQKANSLINIENFKIDGKNLVFKSKSSNVGIIIKPSVNCRVLKIYSNELDKFAKYDNLYFISTLNQKNNAQQYYGYEIINAVFWQDTKQNNPPHIDFQNELYNREYIIINENQDPIMIKINYEDQLKEVEGWGMYIYNIETYMQLLKKVAEQSQKQPQKTAEQKNQQDQNQPDDSQNQQQIQELQNQQSHENNNEIEKATDLTIQEQQEEEQQQEILDQQQKQESKVLQYQQALQSQQDNTNNNKIEKATDLTIQEQQEEILDQQQKQESKVLQYQQALQSQQDNTNNNKIEKEDQQEEQGQQHNKQQTNNNKIIIPQTKLIENNSKPKTIYLILIVISILIILLLIYIIYINYYKKPKVVIEEENDVNNNDIGNTNNDDNDIN